MPWDGVYTVPGAPSTGYCTHGKLLNPPTLQLPNSSDSVLFATWHRPYLALFEVSVSIFRRPSTLI
jgi:tyrosinase